MSMSEFDEEQAKIWDKDISSFLVKGQTIPNDFSEEDLVFALELDTLFALEKEELPPYFVQTLLESEEPRFQPLEHGFELKTRARVFRHLKLHRRLFKHQRPSFHSLVDVVPVRRSLVSFVALIVFMLMTLILTGPSFASGMQILLSGARSGVLLVHNYPAGLKPLSHPRVFNGIDSPPKLSILAAQHRLHSWNMYLPLTLPANYNLDTISLYHKVQQNWIDGPFVELDYALSTRGAPRGTGELVIREFKLKQNVNVLQVVKDGAAQAIKIDSNGHAQAVYVDGQWVLHSSKLLPTWVYGQRCELIYQRDGIIFWIAGDQRDGMNEATLLNIAYSLQPLHISHVLHMGIESDMESVSLLTEDVTGPFSGDVLAIFPYNDVDGPYLSVFGSEQPLPTKPVPKVSHIH